MTVFAVQERVAAAALGQDPVLSVDANATEQEWTRYVEAHPGATVDHLWGWRHVFERVFGQRCVYLAARRDADIVGVLPLVLFRSRLFGRIAVSVPYLNYGGILDSDEAAAAALVARAQEIAADFGAAYLELRNHRRYLTGRPCREHKVRMVLPLPETVDDLWKALDRKVRNQVRKAQKEGLVAESGGATLVDDFYPVFARNMRDLGTPVYSRHLFLETLRAFPDAARVHVVRHQGLPVAGAVSVRFRDTVLVPWASSLRDYRHLCPNMLLYWSMLEAAIRDGAKVFDFGRSSAGAGTHQFKLQWGAAEIPQYLGVRAAQGRRNPEPRHRGRDDHRSCRNLAKAAPLAREHPRSARDHSRSVKRSGSVSIHVTRTSSSIELPSGLREPVACGIPFAPAALAADAGCTLVNGDGTTCDRQATVLARWPDGSAKWLLVEFAAPAHQKSSWSLQLSDGPVAALPPLGDVSGETVRLRSADTVVSVGPGEVIEILRGGQRDAMVRVICTDADGGTHTLAIEDVTLEWNGTQRATALARGRIRIGTSLLNVTVRISTYSANCQITVDIDDPQSEARPARREHLGAGRSWFPPVQGTRVGSEARVADRRTCRRILGYCGPVVCE